MAWYYDERKVLAYYPSRIVKDNEIFETLVDLENTVKTRQESPPTSGEPWVSFVKSYS